MNRPESEKSSSKREAAEYIAAITAELAVMAGAENMEVLQYLLEMARQEAHTIAHSTGVVGK